MIALARRWGLVAALAASGGCVSAAAPPDAHFGSASPLTLDTGIMVRPTVAPPSRGADLPVVVCVDPSLDVTVALAESILARAPRSGGNGTGAIIELAERTRSEAASLRHTLGRLCGEWSRTGLGVGGGSVGTSRLR